MADLLVSPQGLLRQGSCLYRCALGRTGISAHKTEGDGATPVGRFLIRRVLFRPDRRPAPVTRLAVAPIGRQDGWCDDPGHVDYNQPVRLPHPARCERLWRDDGIYDLLAVLGYNDDPPVAGLGSAIFLHLARLGYPGTEGCVALAEDDLLAVLQNLDPGDCIDIRSS